MNRATRRIASKDFERQIKTLSAGDALGDATAAILLKAYNDIKSRIANASPTEALAAKAATELLLAKITHDILKLFNDRLFRLVGTVHAAASDSLAKMVPLPQLTIAADQYGPLLPKRYGDPNLTDEEKRELIKEVVFDPPTPDQAKAIVFRGNWQERILKQTKLGQPNNIADTVFRGMTSGKSEREIADDLQHELEGVASSARRIARQEMSRAALEANFDAWNKLGDMVVGYQVHAVLDEVTRPAHRARNGDIYFKFPERHQLGLDRMPNPPYEADGSIAYNCRCWLSPVLRNPDMQKLEKEAGKIDRELTADWFDVASARDRMTAIGAERYHYLKRVLGREPEWHDVTDSIGRILSMEELRKRHEA